MWSFKKFLNVIGPRCGDKIIKDVVHSDKRNILFTKQKQLQVSANAHPSSDWLQIL